MPGATSGTASNAQTAQSPNALAVLEAMMKMGGRREVGAEPSAYVVQATT